MSTANDCLYSSDVRLPCSVGLSVRVGNIVTECNAFAADFALCHCGHLLFLQNWHDIVINFTAETAENMITIKQRYLL